jgi:uncharacterized membrane protein YidH (DUF202 family)
MKTSNFGIALVILGIMMFVYTGIDFVTNKRVVDIGPIKIDKEENHPIQWSPVVGVVLIVGGIVLVLRGRKARI